MKDSSLVGKLLYGSLFVAVLPAALVVWARAASELVRLPAYHSPALGVAVALAGAVVMMAGMIALRLHGGGLPMNAYPPPRHVALGIYRFLSHPIYLGFSILCTGVSIATGSASGLWLVSPVVMLGCVALVLGYESPDLRSRFGDELPRPWIHLPADEPGSPSTAERISVYLLVLVPWVILYFSVKLLGVPPDAVAAYLPFESRLPVLEWADAFYVTTYPMVAAVPIVAGSKRDLRRFLIHGLLSMAVIFSLFLCLPLIAPPRPFTPHGFAGTLLAWERGIDTAAAAFPSFHVTWSWFAAEVFASRMPAWRHVWKGWVFAVAASCIATGMHAIVDVLAGFAVVALVVNGSALWERLRAVTERIANSWKEWKFGGIRVINHGVYAALGSFLGLLIVGVLAGPGNAAAIFFTASAGLVGAGIWAQWIEGSPRLLRPFGFYGGLIGTVVGACSAPLFGGSAWLLLGAFSVAAPWIQSVGRLRCLVQGCCHGRPAAAHLGIRYVHPKSRVCRLSEFTGVPVHPTPMYSILWNAVVAIAMIRLWILHAPLCLIAGLYLILGGLGRFVEEAYRGEPQTPVFWRLRLYQWMAIASAIAGAVVTAVGSRDATPVVPIYPGLLLPAVAFGLMTWFALGVDFPASNRRFARLA